MRKHLIFTLVIGTLAAAAIAAPQFGKFSNKNVGMVVSYVGNSGTNTSIEVEYKDANGVPFRLFEVVATVGGVATNVTVSRLWTYEEVTTEAVVSTNYFNIVSTNDVYTYTRYPQTNEVYDSTSDTLPSKYYFLNRDIVLYDFGSTTNVTLRSAGTAQ